MAAQVLAEMAQESKDQKLLLQEPKLYNFLCRHYYSKCVCPCIACRAESDICDLTEAYSSRAPTA